MKKLISLFLAIALLLTFLPQAALFTQAADTKHFERNSSGDIPVNLPGGQALTDAYLRGESSSTNSEATIPSSYDSRSKGYITSVKDQGYYGTCWAHAAMASIESSMIKHGVINGDTGLAATTNMNLSESHLAWFTYTNAYDKLGMLAGDVSVPVGTNFLDRGGNGMMATYTLMRWEGPASESTSALKYENVQTTGLASFYAYDYDNAHVTDVEWIPASNLSAVKQAIMKYGAGTISYLHNNTYMNTSTYAYYNPNAESTNHAVTVVGWDDNYSKENFNSSNRPANNGAWIIKNSWGSSWGKNGYFYLSYEDPGCRSSRCYFYKASREDNYENCYQYDGTVAACSKILNKNSQIANIFTANSSESLKAVAVSLRDEATSYTVSIYKNLSSDSNPSSGTLMTTQTGYYAFPGYYTIPLNRPVSIAAGEKFSVVFTLSTPSNYVYAAYDASDEYMDSKGNVWCRQTHVDHGKTSFYKEPNKSWTDAPNNGDFRIKAYTDFVYSGAPSITLSEIGFVNFGDSRDIVGTVNSGTNLTSVTGEIISGGIVKQSYTIHPNTKKLDLKTSAINTNLRFGQLEVGSYILMITAENAEGSTSKGVSFTVEGNKPRISLDSIGTVAYGCIHNITGTVNSGTKLTSVKGEILSGTTVKQTVTVTPNACTLDLKSSDINKNLKFAQLEVGSYTLRITAVNTKGTTVANLSFSVQKKAPSITLEQIGTVIYGNSHPVIGTVNSGTNLTSVKGEILLGSTVKQSYTVKPNKKTLDLRSSAINTNLKFGTLKAGNYTLKITATNATGTTTESVDFTVTSNLTISVDAIGNVTYGKSHNITGTVSSAAKLTSVKGEFLLNGTVKQTVTVAPNAKTLDLRSSAINKNLKFGKLAKGSYVLRITAVDASGTTKIVTISFKIV